MIEYEVILQYIIDGQILQWTKSYWLSFIFTEKENIKSITNRVKTEYSQFELIKISKIT